MLSSLRHVQRGTISAGAARALASVRPNPQERSSSNAGWAAGAAAVALATTAGTVLCEKKLERSPTIGDAIRAPARPDLPIFTREEVKKHTTMEKKIWVTLNGGVYDVTTFATGHPGNKDRIVMAGGYDLSIFWEVYRNHYRSRMYEFIERYRVGSLTPQDAYEQEMEFVFDDPYADDPWETERSNPDFLHTLRVPFCGEPSLRVLANSFYTPNDLHYCRLHLHSANLDKDEWEVSIQGVPQPKTYKLKDLQEKFKHREFACTLQCAGNRREEYNLEGKDVFIAPLWRVAAISNAKYKGVFLRDVLADCGVDVEKLAKEEEPMPENMRHIQFEAYDESETGFTYGVSIPIQKALDPRGDVIFAFEMNGKPLPRDHGYPCRMLVPGFVGNKSCKYIANVKLAKEESDKPWHIKSYRNFPPDISFDEHLSKWDALTPDQLKKGPICFSMPVQSIISDPQCGTIIGTDGVPSHIAVKGVAWTGRGIGVARVDVSLDGGENWTAADFEAKPNDVTVRETPMRMWSWVIFKKNIPIPEDLRTKLRRGESIHLDLVSKGVDFNFNVQPERMRPYYNARGCVVNNIYHVPVTLDPKLRDGERILVTGEDALNPPSGGHFGKPWMDGGWTAPPALEYHERLERFKAKKAAAAQQA